MNRFHSALPRLPQHPLYRRPRHAIHGVDGLRAREPQQAEAGHAEARVPDVDHVAGPVGDAARLGVLAAQDEADEGGAVDPVRAADDLQAAEDPPAVADVLVLLRAAVEAAAGDLALGEPAAEAVGVDETLVVEAPRDGQRRDAREDLARVRLGARADAVPAVEVGAGGDVRHGPVDVDEVQQTQQGEGVEGAVEEAGVLLAPLVAGEGACLPVLQACYDYGGMCQR